MSSARKKRKLSSDTWEEEFRQLKDNVTEANVPKILSMYTASLSAEDQKLLHLLQLYDKSNEIDFAKFSPVVWGPASLEKYDNLKKLGPALWNRPSEAEVLGLFDDQKLWLTALRFPLSLKMETVDCSTVTSDLYDPRFCLSTFLSILGPECLVNCRRFVEKNCLALTLACLSARDSQIRSLAILALSRFLFHLKAVQKPSDDESEEGAFAHKSQYVYLLTLLKNSIPSPNTRIPCIVSHFLLRVCRLLLYPEDPLYGVLNSFLLLKPAMSLDYVPEFYKLFHSSAVESHKRERHWLLFLLADGLREARDYGMLEKQYGMKLLLSFFDSALADEKSRELILRTVKSAVCIPRVCRSLCRSQNLVPWLLTSVTFSSNTKTAKEKELFVEIFFEIWKSVKEEKNSAESTFCSEDSEFDVERDKHSVEYSTGSVKENKKRLFESPLFLGPLLTYCRTLNRTGVKSDLLQVCTEEIQSYL